MEAPLSNLERLAFSKNIKDSSKSNNHLQTNLSNFAEKMTSMDARDIIVPVELMSVKPVENGCNNLGFRGDLNNCKSY